ncbi:MAG: hypothetical protein WC982_13805 [Advenella sp.]
MNADDLVSEVRARGISTTNLSDDNLDTIIGGVLRAYNRYRPRHLHSTITTVQYQGEYDVDVDCTRVIEVFWEPSDTADIVSRVMTELQMIETDFYYPSLLKIYHINKAQMRDTISGNWTMYGRKIRLIPVPTDAGISVPYIYSANWKNLEDIPLSDEELLVEGAVALANVSVARSRAGNAGWQAGDYRVNGSDATSEAARAQKDYDWWLTKLAGAGMGMA